MMTKYTRTLLIRNDKDEPLDLYAEFFVPRIFEVPPRSVIEVFSVSTDPELSNDCREPKTFSIWIEGTGLGIEPPGKTDLIEEFYAVDLISGDRLDER